MKGKDGRACVFFDRDGIVNRPPHGRYVERWEDFHLLPEFVDVLTLVRSKGYEAVIVTNQSGVARGVLTKEAVDHIHERLVALLKEKHGFDILDVLYCPHDDGECECRKPQPGMLLEAAKRHGLDLAASWMVGDQERDIEAGRNAGCRTILVSPEAADSSADYLVGSMEELKTLVARIL